MRSGSGSDHRRASVDEIRGFTFTAQRQIQFSGKILRSKHQSDHARRRTGNRIRVEQTPGTFEREQKTYTSARHSHFGFPFVEDLFDGLDLLRCLDLGHSQPFERRTNHVLDVREHPFVSHGVDAHITSWSPQCLVAGQDDPQVLAELARGKLRSKIPALRQALHGRVTDHHRFLLQLLLDEMTHLEALVARLDARIQEELPVPFAQAIRRLDTIPGINSQAAENILAEESQDHIVAHGRGHQQASLSELSFDIVVAREAVASVRRHADVGSLPRRFGCQQLGHIRFSAAFFAAVEFGGRVETHEIGCFDVGIRLCNGKLYSLIRADGLSKHDAIGGVF